MFVAREFHTIALEKSTVTHHRVRANLSTMQRSRTYRRGVRKIHTLIWKRKINNENNGIFGVTRFGPSQWSRYS